MIANHINLYVHELQYKNKVISNAKYGNLNIRGLCF